MTLCRTDVILLALVLAVAPASAHAGAGDTIKSLERQHVQIRPGSDIAASSELARDNYRAFLELVSDDPLLRAEAMRRLGDLELESMESEELGDNIESLDTRGYTNAIGLFEQLLETYPDYRRNDTVLYQLARGYEMVGETERALDVLDELVRHYPQTPLIGEVQFRRGEMLFLLKNYNDAEVAYSAVIDVGDASRFYEQALYKLGWSRFKLAWHEESFAPFFDLLDRKIGAIEIGDGDARLQTLSRAERELVEDTFRVLSISFSYMNGADSIDEFLATYGRPSYAWVIYLNLGDLYLEKQRFVDAAKTYEAFVEQDPFHPKAPLLQVEVIESYKQGGFPSLVLEGKKAFVDRYRMDGEFWMRNSRADNTAVAAHLRGNLMDLAKFYHAEAQQDGTQDSYQEAARWYRKYLADFPEDAESADSNFLLAEILFESNDYAAASKEYERTAYAYPPHEKSAEAGYAALIAFREHEKSLEGAEAVDWHRAYLDSGLRFADTFPQHPESGAVLTTVAEDLFREGQFDRAIGVGQAVIAKQPAVKETLARTAWTVIAHSQFDIMNFSEAELAYYQLQAYTPDSDSQAAAELNDRIASSIYKQGEIARDAGDLEAAVTHFLRLGKTVPDSDIRATAEYDAAAALINLQAWDRAAGVLEAFRRDYPDSEFSDDVDRKLAVSYVESGRNTDAAREFETIATAEASTEDMRREALWTASDLYQKSGMLSDQQRVLDAFVTRFPRPLSESIEARYRLLEIAESIGGSDERERRLRDIVEADRNAGDERSDRTRYLASRASLELAGPLRERFERVALIQPLAESVKQKRTLMQDVIRAYTDAADYGVAEVTTAATFRLGEAYQRFSADLMASERPSDLDELALEEYELLLEEQVFPFEEKAIALFKVNADRSVDGVYDEWVQRSFARLAGLLPARYAKQERSEDVVTALY